MKTVGKYSGVSFYVEEEDYQRLQLWEYRWTRSLDHGKTYVKALKNRKRIRLHRLIMGCLDEPRSVFIDHIDGNGLNNLRSNLRVTDNCGNQRNRRKSLSAKTSSRFKGVYRETRKNKNPWVTYITLTKGKKTYLGCCPSQEEAALSYNNAAMEHFGVMACLNDLSSQDRPCESE